MQTHLASQQKESAIHHPGGPLVWGISALFALFGAGGWCVLVISPPPSPGSWILGVISSAFSAFGVLVLGIVGYRTLFPACIQHDYSDALADIPTEPLVFEGAETHGHLTHELTRSADGWEFRPSGKVWRSQRRFLVGIGIPFCVSFSAVLSWVLHNQASIANWCLSTLIAMTATGLCGGTAFVAMALILRARHRHLCRLSIPDNGKPLCLDTAVPLNADRPDLKDALEWVFGGRGEKTQLAIDRGRVRVVQLCPWKFVLGGSSSRSTTWTVQGLLVLAPEDGSACTRVPLLLCSDFAGAAKLMRSFADCLGVPFLFHADKAGWKAEAKRAATRPPLRSGAL
jgi:hypothetical protein